MIPNYQKNRSPRLSLSPALITFVRWQFNKGSGLLFCRFLNKDINIVLCPQSIISYLKAIKNRLVLVTLLISHNVLRLIRNGRGLPALNNEKSSPTESNTSANEPALVHPPAIRLDGAGGPGLSTAVHFSPGNIRVVLNG